MVWLVLTRSVMTVRVRSERHITNLFANVILLIFLFPLFLFFWFVCLFFFAQNNKFEAIKTLYGLLNYAHFFCSVLKQMPPFPLIPTVLSGISFLVPGMRFLLIVLKIEEKRLKYCSFKSRRYLSTLRKRNLGCYPLGKLRFYQCREKRSDINWNEN